MNFDFQAILLIATIVTGIVWLLDNLLWRKKRQHFADTNKDANSDKNKQKEPKNNETNEPWFVEYSKSFFPILLIVLIVRSFVVEPFRIPSGSMEPTLYPGDFILVSKSSYGIRLPLLGTEIIDLGKPKRGDVAVFRYPKDPSLDYIKRVVGLPGDEIIMQGQTLWINGKQISHSNKKIYAGPDIKLIKLHANTLDEQLDEVQHKIAVSIKDGIFRGKKLTFSVPKGHYFVMGDNRDNSNDSRFWGFVPQKNLVGRAFMIWMSWSSEENTILWSRIGRSIQ